MFDVDKCPTRPRSDVLGRNLPGLGDPWRGLFALVSGFICSFLKCLFSSSQDSDVIHINTEIQPFQSLFSLEPMAHFFFSFCDVCKWVV